MRQHRYALTMIELLVVIAIIATLIGLLLPAVQQVRAAAARLHCQNQLKQMALAVHHAEQTDGHMPPAGGLRLDSGSLYPLTGSHSYFLLPYLEQQAAHDRLAADAPLQVSCGCGQHSRYLFTRYVSGGDAISPSARTPAILRCPADPTSVDGTAEGPFGNPVNTTSYAANLQVFGNHQLGNRPVTLNASFPDGTSNTAVYAERMARCQWATVGWLNDLPQPDSPTFGFNSPWTGQLRPDLPQVRPRPEVCNPFAVQSHHAGVVLVGVGDGSVRGTRPTVAVELWRAMVLPADGGVVNWD